MFIPLAALLLAAMQGIEAGGLRQEAGGSEAGGHESGVKLLLAGSSLRPRKLKPKRQKQGTNTYRNRV